MKLLTLLLISFFPFICQAQTISELKLVSKPHIAAGELIDNSRRDVNGEIAAGLIILTDLDNLSFESRNGVVGINKKVGQYFLFLSPTERIVTVRATGFKPLTLYLNDIGIRLNSGEVWQIEVTGTKLGDLLPINITVNQPGVLVSIDGTQVDISKPILKEAGEHQIRIEKLGFRTIVEPFTVSNQKTLFNYNLISVTPQAVTIRTNPSGAAVFLDDKYVGVSPYAVFQHPGLYQLKISKSGFKEISQTIEITEEKEFNLSLTLQKFVANLKLNVQPSDASVFINKKEYSGQSVIELSGGTYLIEVSKDGYETQTETVVLKELETLDKSFVLKQQFGILQVKVNNPDAQIEVLQNNGTVYTQFIGLKVIRDIPVGNYSVKASLTGYSSISKQVNVKPNDISFVDIEFTETQKISYLEEQKRLNDQAEAQRLEQIRLQKIKDEQARRKTAALFKAKSFAMIGIEYGPSMSYMFDGKESIGETIGFSSLSVDYDGSFLKFGFDYTTFSNTVTFDATNYVDNYAYRTYFEMGYGVNVSNLYLYASGYADLVDIEFESANVDFRSALDLGLGISTGVILNVEGLGIGAYYTLKALNLVEEVNYSGFLLHVSFSF